LAWDRYETFLRNQDPKETCRVNGAMTAYRSKALTAAGEHFQRHFLRA
jgi:1,2-phenylacetyl-CoA epoxidase PaaB subunit